MVVERHEEEQNLMICNYRFHYNNQIVEIIAYLCCFILFLCLNCHTLLLYSLKFRSFPVIGKD